MIIERTGCMLVGVPAPTSRAETAPRPACSLKKLHGLVLRAKAAPKFKLADCGLFHGNSLIYRLISRNFLQNKQHCKRFCLFKYVIPIPFV